VPAKVHSSEKIATWGIFLLAFRRRGTPSELHIDETGFVFFDADSSLTIGPNASAGHVVELVWKTLLGLPNRVLSASGSSGACPCSIRFILSAGELTRRQ
jgi:hypothetical protein